MIIYIKALISTAFITSSIGSPHHGRLSDNTLCPHPAFSLPRPCWSWTSGLLRLLGGVLCKPCPRFRTGLPWILSGEVLHSITLLPLLFQESCWNHFLLFKLSHYARGARIAYDIKGTAFLMDDSTSSPARFAYQTKVAAMLALTMPVNDDCNPFFLTYYTYYGAFAVYAWIPGLNILFKTVFEKHFLPRHHLKNLAKLSHLFYFHLHFLAHVACH